MSAWWIVPTVVAVALVEVLGRKFSVTYLQKAIGQGVSPELWNTLGVIALISMGVSILLSRFDAIHSFSAKIANKLLLVSFEVGLLGLGVIIGQTIFGFEKSQFLNWQVWFFGIGFVSMILIAILLNFILWFCSQIIYSQDGKTNFMQKTASNHYFFIFFLGLSLIFVPIILLVLER
ncbi:hypothetical protein [Photobacterium indicum]|uniref:hypothetical protein n=1 Tax=Photobacterium indicum TaxID=81447 RepID=UPI0011B2149F|nr:hypothetical protein [Photobacterium indicum]